MNYNILFETYILFSLCCRFQILIIKIIEKILAYHIIINNDIIPKTLIFTNSGKTTHRLTILLQSFLSEKNIIVGELSAQLVSKEREKILNKFINGKIQMYVLLTIILKIEF